MTDSDNVNIQDSVLNSENRSETPTKVEVRKLSLPETPTSSSGNVSRQGGNISPHTPQEQDPAVALGILRRPRGSMIERPASLDAQVPRRVKRLSSLL